MWFFLGRRNEAHTQESYVDHLPKLVFGGNGGTPWKRLNHGHGYMSFIIQGI